jgi:hypothetical protein
LSSAKAAKGLILERLGAFNFGLEIMVVQTQGGPIRRGERKSDITGVLKEEGRGKGF